MLRMKKLKPSSIPPESGGQGYTHTIIAWFGVVPYLFMFIVPLIMYGGKLNISTVDGSYELTTNERLYALLVLSSWFAIAVVFAGLGTKLFPKTRDMAYWPRARLEKVFLYLSIFGGTAFVVHQFFIFPPAVENLIHFSSMAAYWALGLGLCLAFDPSQKASGGRDYWLFLTLLLFMILTLIPLILGKATSVASAGVVLIVSLYVVRARISTKMAAILLASVLVALGMTVKTTLRQVLHEGGVYQRPAIVDFLANLTTNPDTISASQASKEVTANALMDASQINGADAHSLCSVGRGPVSMGGDGNALIKCAEVMADTLENDITAFSEYDQNLDNIIFSREFLGERLHFAVARVVHRLNHLGLLGHVIVSTPDMVPSWGGSTYKSLLFLAVPRAVWPDKPSVGVANLFGRQYGLLVPDDRVTTVNVDPVTEAWMNGGWLAVLLSSAGIGLLFGGILGWLKSGGDQHIRLLVALTVALHVALFESETALIIGGLIQGLLFLGAIVVATQLLSKGHRFFCSMRAS